METVNEVNLSISELQDVNKLSEELTPLSLDEQDSIVGGVLPAILIPAAFTVGRFAPAVIRGIPAAVGAVEKYRDSSTHNTEGKWWSFL